MTLPQYEIIAVYSDLQQQFNREYTKVILDLPPAVAL